MPRDPKKGRAAMTGPCSFRFSFYLHFSLLFGMI